ncbi:MAG: UDP-3-O-(3-hydroxymyristoyl) glucosamine N-acyltransferase [uncultured bacterium]|nr:MAG: UDP-3-O-(3-hydroxymyristoyl) glucosamine N-acyltransferase [uncultured bacterium]
MTIKTVAEIAKLVNGVIIGDKDAKIHGISSIKNAKEGHLVFIANKKYLSFLESTKATVILVDRNLEVDTDKTIIKVDSASKALNKIIVEFFYEEEVYERVISEKAFISKTVVIGKNVCIQNFCNIEDNAKVGDNSIIQAGVYLGKNSTIGTNCIIYPNVTILKNVTIGNNVIIHSGTVIGSDGFGFELDENKIVKILQIGDVVIEDDVEIGSNVSIDRARFDKTIIKRGVKIDNLVHIAHNVEVGENSMLLGQSGIAGSTIVGKGVILAGQSGLNGHITIADGVIIASKSGVTKDITEKMVVAGYPACENMKHKRINGYINRLPDLSRKVNLLEEKLLMIESLLSKKE